MESLGGSRISFLITAGSIKENWKSMQRLVMMKSSMLSAGSVCPNILLKKVLAKQSG